MSSENRQFRDRIYEQFARIGKAISSSKRIELLDLLCQGPRHVEALAKAANLSVANASQHLQALRAARLLDAEKMGVQVMYRLSDPSVAGFLRNLRLLAEDRLAEVDQTLHTFLRDRGAFEPVGHEELLKRVQSGDVTVLDVRPAEEYCAGHLPKALSVPLEELEARMAEFPKDREIVAYCRGPYCVLAIEAAERLRARGFSAFRLDLGITDWQARGLDIEIGETTP
ncbi:MAG: metalloregulator ArsR/SmtB family transcription factor [FCB group bacterium]|jgi:rhodanese-related sulfurtransferase|nr:metalloregulator ArsR/SmtB family transcription factor [FCB group bacterium]